MRRAVLLILCVLALGAAAAPADIVGDWAGALEIGAVRLHLILHITAGEGGVLRATMDSVDQGANGIPVDVITLQGRSLHFEMKALAASYDGALSEDGAELVGDFTQRGMKLPLRLTRTDDASALLPKRPQEPKPPFPYASENVTYSNPAAGVTIAGTLTFPTGAGPHPVVLLISGSGPQDRDEFLMGHRPFLVLADHLTRQGIAVLRVDDRGIGKSTGGFATATTEDFASDVLAGVAYLKTRHEIDPKRIGLIGHSEGGYIAPMVATRSPDVAFIVLLAGPGVPIAVLLREQGRLLLKAGGASDKFIDMNERAQQRMFEIVRRESDPKVAAPMLQAEVDSLLAQLSPRERDAAKATAESGVAMVNSPWFRFLLAYDPAHTLRHVKVPVLALGGELDLQVSPTQNIPAIEKALHQGGNTDVETAVLPGLNHLFQTATTGSVAEYGTIEETMSPLALDRISTWILVRAKLSKQ